MLGGLAEAVECNSIVVHDPGEGAGALALPPDAVTTIDLVVCDEATTFDALVSRLPFLAGKVVPRPDLRTTAQAADWLNGLAGRLRPRPKETRWTRTLAATCRALRADNDRQRTLTLQAQERALALAKRCDALEAKLAAKRLWPFRRRAT